ncbi:MAG: fold metallo-hydrolase, partial [Belnapia sp.]|nr:fold metallo-hydrolase [Belnapia sp.]
MSIPFLKQDPLAHGAVERVPVPGGRPLVRRLVCNNPSAFTFRGTNTYIIGEGQVAVMDPGPEDAAHLAAILAATAGETITQVVITHTHRDHSPGARPLVA